jgi:hypothetical protein
MEKDIEGLRATCEILWRDFNNCKAHFPYVPLEAKGAKRVRTAPFYIAQGFDVEFMFNKGISEEGIKRINQIGHWLNQNFVIRLCAVLESFGVIAGSTQTTVHRRIDFGLEGAEHVNIVRRLRNCFAHSSGRYDPKDPEHQKTLKLISHTLGIPVDGLTDWPISIDTVLKPLYDGCIKYAMQKEKSA